MEVWFKRRRDGQLVRQKCVFCTKLEKIEDKSFTPLLNKALYTKYSSSQNYYYSKDINDILDQETTQAVIKYKDIEVMVEDEEYLKRYASPILSHRFYYPRELPRKQESLLEYYKYHKDIPRLFMKNVQHTIYKFHEKKRRIDYALIKKQLGIVED